MAKNWKNNFPFGHTVTNVWLNDLSSLLPLFLFKILPCTTTAKTAFWHHLCLKKLFLQDEGCSKKLQESYSFAKCSEIGFVFKKRRKRTLRRADGREFETNY